MINFGTKEGAADGTSMKSDVGMQYSRLNQVGDAAK